MATSDCAARPWLGAPFGAPPPFPGRSSGRALAKLGCPCIARTDLFGGGELRMASNERDGDLPFANYHSPIKRSPDGAQRNPGAAEKPAAYPDFALPHPGCEISQQRARRLRCGRGMPYLMARAPPGGRIGHRPPVLPRLHGRVLSLQQRRRLGDREPIALSVLMAMFPFLIVVTGIAGFMAPTISPTRSQA